MDISLCAEIQECWIWTRCPFHLILQPRSATFFLRWRQQGKSCHWCEGPVRGGPRKMRLNAPKLLDWVCKCWRELCRKNKFARFSKTDSIFLRPWTYQSPLVYLSELLTFLPQSGPDVTGWDDSCSEATRPDFIPKHHLDLTQRTVTVKEKSLSR